MRTRRTLPTLALLAFATIGLAACVAINETVTERDYDCGEVQDDLCIRVVDLVMSPAGGLDRAPVHPVTVRVMPVDCADIGRGPMEGRLPGALARPPAKRCWRIEGEDSTNEYWFGRWVYENDDGILRATG